MTDQRATHPWLRHAVTALSVAVITGASTATAQAQDQVQDRTPVIAITNTTVLTVTNGTFENGTVVVTDGRISAVGANVEVPVGAEVVDASGRFVSPGIIDAHTHMPAESINESGTTVSSMTRIADVLNPTDINLYRDLAGGVTTANVLHGSANPIGGTNAVIKLRWGKPRASDLILEGAMPGIKFALGENPTRGGRAGLGQRPPLRYPASRPGVEFVIRDAFTRAKAYRAQWQEYERLRTLGEDVLAPRRDLQLEPLVEILDGERLVHAHSYRADEILMLLRLAEELGFRVTTLQHVLEGYKVAKEIAQHDAGASTFADWWGYKIEAVDATPYNAALMLRKGVLVSINSDSAEHSRRLNVEAAKTMKWGGLTEDEALALVTINPARQLRIDDQVGSIGVGKDADLVIWTHHPLSAYAVVDRVYIDGEVYYDRLEDVSRITELKREKAMLLAEALPPDGQETSSTDDDDSGEPRGARMSGQGSGSTVGTAGRASAATAPSGATNSDRVVAITNARIVSVAQPTIDRGTIIIRGNQIDSVGAEVSVPAGAAVIDANGGHVYPGWINPWTTIGLSDPGAGGYADATELHEFNPHLRTRVAYHNDSDAIPIGRANGITTVGVALSGGLLGGQVAVMNLDGWTWEESTVRPSAGISMDFPIIETGSPLVSGSESRSFDELKAERDAKLDQVADVLERARAYARTTPGPGQTDWMLEALIPVVDREVPVYVTATSERAIRDAVAFAERVAIDIVLVDAIEAPLVAPLLAEKDIPVILGPVLRLPTREDMFHAEPYQAAAKLVAAGVKFALSTGVRGGSGAPEWSGRQLPFNAAMSVAWGLSHEDAIRAITINAAELLGVDDRLGSIEPGKVANLLIANGDPLEIPTEVTHVLINGRSVSLGNRHLALYERYRARP